MIEAMRSSKKCRLLAAALWIALSFPSGASDPVLRVVRASQPGASLLRNGGFEDLREGRPAGWSSAPQGCTAAAGQGRDGSKALLCDNPSGKGWYGASQTLTLNQTSAAPVVVRGWSKAQAVSGGTDSSYSLYADLLYQDGTPLWGQTANFRAGTHDWERREMVIVPEKPVKSLTLHCLFRGRAGKVWFDDVQVEEVRASDGAALFQGVPVAPVQPVTPQPGNVQQPRPGSLDARRDQRSQLQDYMALPRAGSLDWSSHLMVRDVAANSDFFPFENGVCQSLGLKVVAEPASGSAGLKMSGQVLDTTGKDRAITLVFAWPCPAEGWHWGDDIRRERVMRGNGDYFNQVAVRCGATGTMSLYPLGAVWNEQQGLALGLDMDRAAQYRIGCHAGLRLLYLAFDFGLVKETERLPGGAAFRFVLFSFDPRWGYRSAWQKYMGLFTECFVVRSKDQGIWMPFTDVSTVQGWQDFGFRYHEGNNNVAWDDEHGVLSFRYTEPMTWWMSMKKELPRTPPEATQVRDELARGKDGSARRMAAVTEVAAMHDEAGQPGLQFQDTPWCNGAVWSLNPNPWLGGGPDGAVSGELNAATVHWNPKIRDQLYGPAAKGRLDGEYLDSLEGYVTADLNFRRDHFRRSSVPLTFSQETGQPALFKGLAVYEFTRWISEDVHRLGKLMFANGVPYRFTFLCPWLDVLGTETDWLSGGKYRPATLPQMDMWRTLSGAKPYLLLMNTDYDRFDPELVEKYFQRCLFYGMWPGFFSHNAAENPYWGNPKWYNRDRPLFKKYLPLVKRVAEAGWQPAPGAACTNPRLQAERFGPTAEGTVYLTVYNDTAETQRGRITPDGETVRVSAGAAVIQDLVSGRECAAGPGGFDVLLGPGQTGVFALRK
jgi:hypothetical protein